MPPAKKATTKKTPVKKVTAKKATPKKATVKKEIVTKVEDTHQELQDVLAPPTSSDIAAPKFALTETQEALQAVRELTQAPAALKEIEKTFRIVHGTTDMGAMHDAVVSTGLLQTDLLLSGGIHAGWYSLSGLEGSTKSTTLNMWMASIAKSTAQTIIHADVEGSSSPEYQTQILQAQGSDITLEDLYGLQDGKGGYLIQPRVHYYNESSGDTVWKLIAGFLKRLPDKVYDQDYGWVMAFENSRPNQARLNKFRIKKLSDESGKIVIKSPDGGALQAFIMLDSYAAMVADSDDDDEGSNGLGQDARMHSKHVKKVQSRLKKKHCAFVGVSQLREKPMAKPWEEPFYETGGTALKFASSTRLQHTRRAVPPPGKGKFEEEPSVLIEGGTDRYMYVHTKAVKNKFGVDSQQYMQRLWISDPMGLGRGIDIVYDCFAYLKSTGQLTATGSRSKIQLNIKGSKVEYPKLKWIDFKRLILLKGTALNAFCKELGIKDPKLRERCFKQIKDKSAQEMYFEEIKNASSASDD